MSKISAYPEVTTPGLDDVLPIVSGGVTKKVKTRNLVQQAPGGDLNGPLSAATVTGLRGRPLASTAPSSGQVIGWDGSQYKPVNAPSSPGTNAAQLQGHDVDEAAPSDGDALIWVNSENKWKPRPVVVGASAADTFDPMSYDGVVGNGIADDSNPVGDAIDDLNANGGGKLILPRWFNTGGGYEITVPALIEGHISSNAFGDPGASRSILGCSSATETLLTISSLYAKFRDVMLVNQGGSTPSAGAGIVCNHASSLAPRVSFDNVVVKLFYDNIDVKVGAYWTMRDSILIDSVRYGIRIRNLINADAGDWNITESWIYQHTRDGESALRWESSGGGKITNLKINGSGVAGVFATGIDADISGTGILQMTNNSIENLSGRAINFVGPDTMFEQVLITNLQIGMYDNSTVPIYIENVRRALLAHVDAYHAGEAVDYVAEFHNCQLIQETPFLTHGYNHHVYRSGTNSDTPDVAPGDGFNEIGFAGTSFSNSWVNAGSPWHDFGFARINGEVKLRGVIGGGTLNSKICTLPVGYRPGAQLEFQVPCTDTSAPYFDDGNFCNLRIESNGDVTQKGAGSGLTALSLDGISFRP